MPERPVPIVNGLATDAVIVSVPPKLIVVPLIVNELLVKDALGIFVNVLSDAFIVTPVNDVMVLPNETVVDPMVIELLVNDAFAIFVKVLLEPLMDLFVRVCVPVSVTTVLSIEIVPDVVIGPPVSPVPVLICVTVPEAPDPLDAAVIRPLEFTVMLALVYEPGVTPELSILTTIGAPAPLSVTLIGKLDDK